MHLPVCLTTKGHSNCRRHSYLTSNFLPVVSDIQLTILAILNSSTWMSPRHFRHPTCRQNTYSLLKFSLRVLILLGRVPFNIRAYTLVSGMSCSLTLYPRPIPTFQVSPSSHISNLFQFIIIKVCHHSHLADLIPGSFSACPLFPSNHLYSVLRASLIK